MTFEEALELFGLSRIPSEAVLKVLRNDAVKEAMEAKDEERQKDIHRAFAVLTGKEDAELNVGQGVSDAGPTGIVKASCREHKDKPFVLEWVKAHKSPLDDIDKVVMSNPQKLEWDSNIDGFVRINSEGKRFNYDDKDYSKADGSPFDPNGENWKSNFEAEIVMMRPARLAKRLICNGVSIVTRSFVTEGVMITLIKNTHALIVRRAMVGGKALQVAPLRKPLMENISDHSQQKNARA